MLSEFAIVIIISLTLIAVWKASESLSQSAPTEIGDSFVGSAFGFEEVSTVLNLG